MLTCFQEFFPLECNKYCSTFTLFKNLHSDGHSYSCNNVALPYVAFWEISNFLKIEDGYIIAAKSLNKHIHLLANIDIHVHVLIPQFSSTILTIPLFSCILVVFVLKLHIYMTIKSIFFQVSNANIFFYKYHS